MHILGAKRLYESLYSPFADMNLWIEFIIYCISIDAEHLYNEPSPALNPLFCRAFCHVGLYYYYYYYLDLNKLYLVTQEAAE